ncbi:hypothetical protein [Shinella sp.]|uniref:hypothetical protein n=1 Tax=Shinella sp. TaxID=1870904 RepID=UPI003F70A12C
MTTLKPSKGRRVSSPLSLRLTPEERATLEAAAGGRALGAYIRARLFAGEGRHTIGVESDGNGNAERLSPEARQRLLAQILGALGQSRALRSLSELAEAARIGVLPLAPDVLADIRAACAGIQEIRLVLLRALGLKPPQEDRDDFER